MGVFLNLMMPTNWGKLDTYQSRWLEFGVNLYFTVIHDVYLVWAMIHPPSLHADMYACIIFCSGWISFPLHVRQIFSHGDKKDCGNQDIEETDGNDIIEETDDGFKMSDILWRLYFI